MISVIFNMLDFAMSCIKEKDGIFMCVLVDPLNINYSESQSLGMYFRSVI